ncbi:phage tail tape measure protein [Pseudolysinimonas sp.]|uniref:phage tail tape measure protein n=1 Tax=Pseudolysinimonas sp. TaxID=2680009 RepID=UPI003F7F6B1A
MSAEEFSLEARLDFIISGLNDALSQLDNAESKINGVVTGLGELGEKFAGAGKETEGYAADLLDAQTSVELLRIQVGELTQSLNTEELATTRGSDAWVKRVQALSQAQREYATFAKNQLTGAETGQTVDPETQSGTTQRDNLATMAARDANYAQVISNAAKEIEVAEQRIQKAMSANAYDSQVQQLGAVAAAKLRLEQADRNLAAATEADARVQAQDASLPAQARAHIAVANAMDEQRAAVKALSQAEQQEQRAAAAPPTVNLFGKDLAEGQLPRVRYALYDVSFAAGIMGAALTGAFAGAVATAASFEADFAQVQRTVSVTGQDAADLKQQFVELSQTIPVSFGDLSQIGALGGQLNIAAGNLTNFTRVTAEFAATTNVSIDQSGTALGRLDQLLDKGSGAYENLASSILKVGVNSVATESQIIAISQNIAGIAGTVGLTTDQVVGLSGALASIGTAPESARSSVTRLFMDIQTALNGDTALLTKFGSVAGMTGEQFRAAWGNDPGKALTDLLQGVNAQGDNATATLEALGITSTRDIPTLLKLAQNTDLVSDSLSNAKSGFNDATELANQYGITSETLSARLQILGNSLQDLLASIGGADSGPLTGLISLLTEFVNQLNSVVSTPAGQWFAGLGLVIGAAAGAAALLAAVTARVAGSYLAVRTAAVELGISTTSSTTATIRNTAAIGAEAIAVQGDTEAKIVNAAATTGLRDAEIAATFATNGFKVALASTGIGLAVVALGTLVTAFMQAGDAAETSKSKAKDFFGGQLPDLSSAMQKDQAQFEATGEAIQQVSTKVTENGRVADGWVKSLDSATGAQAGLSDNTSHATKTITDQTIAYGENAKAALASALANSKSFQNLFKDTSGLNQLKSAGFNQKDFASAILGDPVNGGKKYVDGLAGSVAAELGIKKQQLTSLFDVLNDPNKGQRAAGEALYKAGVRPEDFQQVEQLAAAFKQVDDAANSSSVAVKGQANAAAASAAASDAAGLSAAGAADGYGAMSDAAGDATDQNIAYGDQLKSLIDDHLKSGTSAETLAGNLSTLGQAFAQQGATAALSGSAIATVLDTIAAQSSGGPEAAARMNVLFNALVAGGYASWAQLQPLIASMATLTGVSAGVIGAQSTGSAVNAMLTALKNGSAGAAKGIGGAGGAAKSAAKEIRTLVDYGNDLSGVFKRMDDIRFGPQQALDSIAGAWNDIADNGKDAKEKIDDAAKAIDEAAQKAAKAQATLAGLAADKSNDEYWLRIATEYGDMERVKQLQADLAKNTVDTAAAQSDLNDANADATKAQSDMTDAQQAASMSLVGNSQAAIDNRKALTDLVGDYQDYIQALAASGVPQDQLRARVAQLKQEFINQATQMGYNANDVMAYAASFDDMTRAINAVPRNITVGLDISGVDAAIAEFQAKLNAAKQSAGGGGGGGGGGGTGFDWSKLLDGLPTAPAGPQKQTIVFDGDTKLVGDALNRVYEQVKQSKPVVSIGGHNVDAMNALTTTLNAINQGKSEVTIGGRPQNAQAVLQQILQQIDSTAGNVTINGQTAPAGSALAALLGAVNRASATVTINGKAEPADKVLEKALAAIKAGHDYVTIDGKKEKAEQVKQQALNSINSSSASISINAQFNSGQANDAGQLMARSMRAGIVSYLTNNPVRLGVNGTSQGSTTLKPYWDGGFTGAGSKYQAAGIVHAGEYVFPREAVRYYGVENLAYMHQRATRGYANGGPVAGAMPAGGGASAGQSVTTMSATDRMFFRDLFSELGSRLGISDGVIADAYSAATARAVKAGNR